MKLLTSSKNMIDSLQKIGIVDSYTLLHYLPYRYENFYYDDEENIFDKKRLVLLGKLIGEPKLVHTTKMDLVTFFIKTNNGNTYSCVGFGRAYLKTILNTNDEWTIIGNYDEKYKRINVINVKKGMVSKEDSLKSVYHLPHDIKLNVYSSLVRRTLDKKEVVDLVPSFIKKKYRLLSHYDALNKIHFPSNEEDIYLATRTMKYEECLEFCLKNKIIRDENKKIVRTSLNKISFLKIDQLINSLPFRLDEDQLVACKEIINDMNSPSIMYRLLQGDVGSGKTVVACVSLYAATLRKNQGALMVPTDSLARQHYETIKAFLSPFNIKVDLLVASLQTKEKKAVKERIKNGETQIIIGTHAVFSKDVEYFDLGLAIIDEQHRFGVNQRNLLAAKGPFCDLLLMSATPIPRTLSLSIFGDLDVSTLKVFPHKKRDVITKVCDYDSKNIDNLIIYCMANKKKVFMVCPKIETNKNNGKSVEEIYDFYKRRYGDSITLLHGKMDNNEKVEILDKFKNGNVTILVATTIVELGIDIKNAGGMIIFSANSFGLSSLHQLRGRVGRDGGKSYCLLVDHFEEGESSERLKFLENNDDGFLIAEEDMKLRGPGDALGVMQSGFPTFSCLNIVSDFKMFQYARDDASKILNSLEDSENKRYFDFIQDKMKKDDEQIHLFD